ncbi:hypothetical protein M885DRAFT_522054 [Pelagophyceae sp. CCMP2097]|nr:hypothetical protein M885DRAFT_522054 [Pelagophyceae sp. CCMP2097]
MLAEAFSGGGAMLAEASLADGECKGDHHAIATAVPWHESHDCAEAAECCVAHAIDPHDCKAEDVPYAALAEEADDSYGGGHGWHGDRPTEVSLEELQPRADGDGVKRRALALRDAIFTGQHSLYLRGDDFSGRLEDVAAIVLGDSEERSVLHHAAYLGRRGLIVELLRYAETHLTLDGNVGGESACRAYCALLDDGRRRAVDLARAGGHLDCVALLQPHSRDRGDRGGYLDETKAESKDDSPRVGHKRDDDDDDEVK